ncbi:MAG: pyruvate dehydrogenase (acetyl-transferring) E1 component subunit alpha [Burkholderiales bacterium]
MKTTVLVARFEIHFNRFLDHEGKATQDFPDFASPKALIELYSAMVLTRTFDAKAVALQRTGQLGTFASTLGQEAVGVGVASAMQASDVLLPTYRESGAMLLRGVKMEEILGYWGGDERGSDYAGPRQDFPICVPIATQAGHAVGVATAMKLRKEARAAVCMGGDGCTSKGDFYEAMNLAGAWKLPVVFFVANNQWAISVPCRAQTATQTLAQKAIAAGIEGWQVDGNDVIAVRDAAERALAKARSGKGATLIEALTYRLHDHTTADDATRYRAAEEVEAAWELEPVKRLRTYLHNCSHWSKEQEERLVKECAEKVQKSVETYLAAPPPDPSHMFDHLYATLPAALKSQRDAAVGKGSG